MPCTSSDRARAQESAELGYGIAVTVAGVVLTLGSLGLADASALLRFWPVLLVIAGAVRIVRSGAERGHLHGWFLVIIGMWLLTRTVGHAHVQFWDLVWPMALVALGVRLWMNATRVPAEGARAAPPRPPLGATASRLTAILAGSTRVVQDPSFPGAAMTAVLGNCLLDLRHAGPPAGGEAIIEAFLLLGALELVVPDGWTVVVDATTVGAEVDDQRSSFAGRTVIEGDTRPRVRVVGTLVLGALTIKT
jgi:hypothetical protein